MVHWFYKYDYAIHRFLEPIFQKNVSKLILQARKDPGTQQQCLTCIPVGVHATKCQQRCEKWGLCSWSFRRNENPIGKKLKGYLISVLDIATSLLCPDSSGKTEFKTNLIWQGHFKTEDHPNHDMIGTQCFKLAVPGTEEKDMKIAELEGKDHKWV